MWVCDCGRTSIRQLDRGGIDTDQFRIRLKALGCEMPAGVDRLLVEYQANGRATFKQFVRAFEKYFATQARKKNAAHAGGDQSHSIEAAARRARSTPKGIGGARGRATGNRGMPGSSRAPTSQTVGYMDRSHLTTFTEDETPAAMRTHGDILTWTNNPPVRGVHGCASALWGRCVCVCVCVEGRAVHNDCVCVWPCRCNSPTRSRWRSTDPWCVTA